MGGTQTPTAASGSALAGDDAKTHPHQVSRAAIRYAGIAVDHLRSMRTALTCTGDGVLVLSHLRAVYADASGARKRGHGHLVDLARHAQRPDSPTTATRIASIKATESFLEEPDAARHGEIARRKERVHGIADRCGPTHTAVSKKPSPSEIVKNAGTTARLVDNQNKLGVPPVEDLQCRRTWRQLGSLRCSTETS